MVRITPGPGSLVTVAETMSGGSTVASTSLFVSTDDGRTFTQHPPRSESEAGMYWASVTLLSEKTGLVIAGPNTYPHDLLYTTDGGDTWAESKVTGIVAAPYNQPGAPMVIGSDIVVPVNECDTDCSDNKYTFLLLVSHDGGASFSPEGTPFVASGLGYSAVGSLGQVIWVVDGGAIHETADGGATWASVPTSSLSFEALDLTGPTTATAIAIDSGCAAFKTDCWYDRYIVFTTDGGRTWSRA
jgi:photosystem II stability/assembly factor-like uncharacterized protein